MGWAIACALGLVGCSSESSDDDGAAEAGQGGSAGSGAGGGGSGGGSSGESGKGGSSGASGEGGGAGTGGGGSGTGGTQAGTSGGGAGSGGSPAGEGPELAGCPVFPPEDAWNTDISEAPVDADWTERLQNLVGDVNLHPDYGSDGDTLYGIPFNVVPAEQPLVPVTFDWYPEESDEGPYPFPGLETARVEGFSPEACDGDCHLLVVQQGSCMLYEGYACEHRDDGWHCGNGAKWDLTRVSYGQRPRGYTSADAAGLAILPGLVRYDEVRSGEMRHAVRFTTHCTRANFVAPATHLAVPGSCDADDPNAPPMGLRVRLRADFDITSFSESAQVVLTAMKRYGMILADNGSDFYFQGEAHSGWNEDDIEPLKDVPASAFEAIVPGPLEQ
jgi:hypothetical protein